MITDAEILATKPGRNLSDEELAAASPTVVGMVLRERQAYIKGYRTSLNAGTKDELWRVVQLDAQTRKWLKQVSAPPLNEDK